MAPSRSCRTRRNQSEDDTAPVHFVPDSTSIVPTAAVRLGSPEIKYRGGRRGIQAGSVARLHHPTW
eukprot:2731240-Rhodomonas_salina.3